MELHHRIMGQGEPLLILHGLFGTADNWQSIAKQLAEKHMLVLPDLRNHGRSPHAEAINYPLMANDVHDFLGSQWMHRVQLMGHSMGGKVAMCFALQYPDMVDKLVVVDIAPRAYAGGHEAIFEALLAIDLDTVQERGEVEAQLMARIPEAGVVQFLMKNLSRRKEGGFAWKMNLPAIHRHYADILAAIDSPHAYEGEALFIAGAESRYIREADHEGIRRLFPQARIEYLAGAGHWVHADKPRELLALLEDFLG